MLLLLQLEHLNVLETPEGHACVSAGQFQEPRLMRCCKSIQTAACEVVPWGRCGTANGSLRGHACRSTVAVAAATLLTKKATQIGVCLSMSVDLCGDGWGGGGGGGVCVCVGGGLQAEPYPIVCSMTSGAMKQGFPQNVFRARYCLWDQEGSRCREEREDRLPLEELAASRTVVGEDESRLGWDDKTPDGVPHEVSESERSRVAATPKSASITLPLSSIKMFSACATSHLPQPPN